MDTRAVRRLESAMPYQLLHPDGTWQQVGDYKRFWSEAESVTEHEFRVLVNDYLGVNEHLYAAAAAWLLADQRRAIPKPQTPDEEALRRAD
jgi:hypothetical protein